MTIYYRVDLQNGITVEDQEPIKKEGKRNKVPYYSGSPEFNQTVFKSIRAAKRQFYAMTKAEIQRLQELRAKFRSLYTRDELATGEELASHVELG